jgi:hypothetical protein
MHFCRSVLTALGIVLAVVATPASAGLRNFFGDGNPAPSPAVPTISDPLLDEGLPQDDPIDLPDPLKQDDNLPPPDQGDEQIPFDPPVVTSLQLESVNEGPQTAQVPEPATISLLALALLAMGWRHRRQG